MEDPVADLWAEQMFSLWSAEEKLEFIKKTGISPNANIALLYGALKQLKDEKETLDKLKRIAKQLKIMR